MKTIKKILAIKQHHLIA